MLKADALNNRGGTVLAPVSNGGNALRLPITIPLGSAQNMDYFAAHDNFVVVLGRIVYYDIHERQPYYDRVPGRGV
jgi:hypothetical protein